MRTHIYTPCSRKQLPSQDRMITPLLRIIRDMGGRIVFSIHGREIEDKFAGNYEMSLADREYADPSRYNSEGHRWLRNLIQQVRRKCVHWEYLDNSLRDVWELTDRGHDESYVFWR